MAAIIQPLLDELRRLAATVNVEVASPELRFVNHLTLAYLHAENGDRRDFDEELRAAEGVAPGCLLGRLRGLARGVRIRPVEGAAVGPSRRWPRSRAVVAQPCRSGSRHRVVEALRPSA